MQVQQWRPGQKVAGPVYVDTNIWVGFILSNHRLYRICSQLMTELFAAQIMILYSHVVHQEILWAVASQSFFDLYHRGRSTKFGKDIYRRNKTAIWGRYGPRFGSVASLPGSFASSGLAISCVPNDSKNWLDTMQPTHDYMLAALEPADATHLSLAGLYANTFITADADFVRAAGQLTHPTLTILHVR